jgi:C-terminal processing protease CtpA/Prc
MVPGSAALEVRIAAPLAGIQGAARPARRPAACDGKIPTVPLRRLARTAGTAAAALAALALAMPAAAQSIATNRQRGTQMLDQIREDLVQHYYDPTFGGLDLDDRVDRVRQRINTAQSLGEIFGLLASICIDLGDSHTVFVPPQRANDIDYGWTWRYVGDRALVSWVAGDSDARRDGLRVGDTVIDVAGYTLTRANERTVRYLLTSLRPQPQLQITVERDGTRRSLTADARIRKRRRRLDLNNPFDRYLLRMREAMANASRPKPKQKWIAGGVLYWRLPDFFATAASIRGQAGKLARARQVILDLRGNPGGDVAILQRVAGLFAPHATPVLVVRSRAGTDTLGAIGDGSPFAGDVVVLVDSASGSSAEILARFLQQRGVRVVGDVTRGAVTGARLFEHTAGEGDIRVPFAVMVTVSDVLMPDGSPLERVGVRPDLLSLPTPDDLDRGADPVLATAAALLHVTLDPLRAGRFSRP